MGLSINALTPYQIIFVSSEPKNEFCDTRILRQTDLTSGKRNSEPRSCQRRVCNSVLQKIYKASETKNRIGSPLPQRLKILKLTETTIKNV